MPRKSVPSRKEPLILIPGGTRVDVMFTKGVHIGGRDVQKKLANARSDKKK